MFSLAILLAAPAEIRMERVKNREYARWGDQICNGGNMYELQSKFYAKVAARDVGVLEEIALMYSCPLLRVDSAKTPKDVMDEILTYISFRDKER